MAPEVYVCFTLFYFFFIIFLRDKIFDFAPSDEGKTEVFIIK